MKNVNKIATLLLLIFSGHVTAATITTSFTPSVNVDDIFTVDIIGTDFIDNVDGGGVNLSFDQNVLNVLSISIDESVWDFGSSGIDTGTVNNAAGTVSGIMVNTFSSVTGDFLIASLEVQAISDGVSLLGLTEFGGNPWASGGSMINPDFVNNSITISGVPLPGSFWLMISGLGLLGFRFKNK